MAAMVQQAPVQDAPAYRPHFHRHNQQQQQHSYTAAIPVETGSSQPTLYKQINVIPGLDADNAVVDTGVTMVRPTGGQVQVS